MNSTTNKRLHSFLVNDDFINYVLNSNLILKEMWEDYMSTHPEDIAVLNEATNILLGVNEALVLTTNEASDLEYSILKKCGIAIC